MQCAALYFKPCVVVYHNFSTIPLFTLSVHFFLPGAPKDIDYNTLKEDLLSIHGVQMAHSLHLWSLTTHTPAMAVHLAVGEYGEAEIP